MHWPNEPHVLVIVSLGSYSGPKSLNDAILYVMLKGQC